MTSLFKKRWPALLGALLLAMSLTWNVTTLRAQNQVPPSQGASSPEEVAKQFMNFLAFPSRRRYEQYPNTIFVFDKRPIPISQKSLRELKDSLGPLTMNMGMQLEAPHFKATLSQSNEQNAHVTVERDEITHSHEVVLIREKGEWKVDVVATYAVWNKLTEAEARKRIQAIYGKGTLLGPG